MPQQALWLAHIDSCGRAVGYRGARAGEGSGVVSGNLNDFYALYPEEVKAI